MVYTICCSPQFVVAANRSGVEADAMILKLRERHAVDFCANDLVVLGTSEWRIGTTNVFATSIRAHTMVSHAKLVE